MSVSEKRKFSLSILINEVLLSTIDNVLMSGNASSRKNLHQKKERRIRTKANEEVLRNDARKCTWFPRVRVLNTRLVVLMSP